MSLDFVRLNFNVHNYLLFFIEEIKIINKGIYIV